MLAQDCFYDLLYLRLEREKWYVRQDSCVDVKLTNFSSLSGNYSGLPNAPPAAAREKERFSRGHPLPPRQGALAPWNPFKLTPMGDTPRQGLGTSAPLPPSE